MRHSRQVVLVLFFGSILAGAQVPIRPEGIPIVNALFDSKPEEPLACSIRSARPFLDFMFRYNTGFLIAVRFDQFTPGEHLVAYLRIAPRDGKAVIMGEIFQIPVMTPDVAERMDAKKLSKIEVGMSGGFWIGEGRYTVDVILLDGQRRSCRKHWNLGTPKRPQGAGPLALEANTVEPIRTQAWDGKLDTNGLRLTVLLHATPISPLSPKLRAWDRAFLLQALAALLKQLPCQSVRVIAFNLDQRQEIFRQEQFDVDGFTRLGQTLRDLELDTISVRALERRDWPGLLLHLAEEQAVNQDPSDAVIFLGPTSPRLDSVPSAITKSLERGSPRFFYFEYYPFIGSEFGDPIDSLTHDLHGTVYRIHSADQLRKAIQKMLGQIKPQHKIDSSPAGPSDVVRE